MRYFGGRVGVYVAAMIMLAATVTMPALPRASTACAFDPPAEFAIRLTRWLGGCAQGKAEGLGVIRYGAAAPYAFFAGQMQGGRPVSGMLISTDGLFRVAKGFDARLQTIDADGEYPAQQDAVFALATRAADATARRFAIAGNNGSAAYYRALAIRIRDGQPE